MSQSTFSGPVRSQAGFISTTGGNLDYGTVVTDTTAAAVTYTAAQLKAGLILRDPNGAGRSDVTPTAAAIVQSYSATGLSANTSAVAGDYFEFTIRNTADAAETITITAGTGVTLSGTMTIAQSNSKRFRLQIDTVTPGSEAATLYSLGTVVH